jgi:hypothetical protein
MPDVDALTDEFDRFGPPPEEARNLLYQVRPATEKAGWQALARKPGRSSSATCPAGKRPGARCPACLIQ